MNRMLFILLCMIFVVASCAREQSQDTSVKPNIKYDNTTCGIKCILSVKRKGIWNDLYAEVKFTNLSDREISCWKVSLLMEDLDGAISFQVKRGGIDIPYQGPMIKRPPPKPEDYYKFLPGTSVISSIKLKKCFDISIRGQYTISFTLPYSIYSETGCETHSNIVEFNVE